jgi:hypothetical protein
MTTCSATSTTTGERCGRAPAKGSDKCKFHGAGSPQAKAAAARRVAEREVAELAGHLDVEVPRFASAAEAAKYLVDRVAKRSAQFGALADELGANLVYSDAIGVERLRAAVAGERQWLESLTRLLGVLVQAEQAANRTDYSTLRSQLTEDIVETYNSALVTVTLRRRLVDGPDLSEFTREVWQEFKRALQWRVRDTEGQYGGSGRSRVGTD